MRKIEIPSSYLRYLKKVKKYPKFDNDKYNDIIRMIVDKQKIPPQYKDHPLAKHSPDKYKGCRDVHISPNIVLVYRATDDAVQLVAIGSHQDLGLTEDFNGD